MRWWATLPPPHRPPDGQIPPTGPRAPCPPQWPPMQCLLSGPGVNDGINKGAPLCCSPGGGAESVDHSPLPCLPWALDARSPECPPYPPPLAPGLYDLSCRRLMQITAGKCCPWVDPPPFAPTVGCTNPAPGSSPRAVFEFPRPGPRACETLIRGIWVGFPPHPRSRVFPGPPTPPAPH